MNGKKMSKNLLGRTPIYINGVLLIATPQFCKGKFCSSRVDLGKLRIVQIIFMTCDTKFLFFDCCGASTKFGVFICFILVSLTCFWFLSAQSNKFVYCFFFFYFLLCRIIMYVTTLSGIILNSHQREKVLLMDY